MILGTGEKLCNAQDGTDVRYSNDYHAIVQLWQGREYCGLVAIPKKVVQAIRIKLTEIRGEIQ